MKVITQERAWRWAFALSLNHPSVNEGDHPFAARSDRRGGPNAILINLLHWFSWLACRPIEVSLFHAPDRILASPDTPGDGGDLPDCSARDTPSSPVQGISSRAISSSISIPSCQRTDQAQRNTRRSVPAHPAQLYKSSAQLSRQRNLTIDSPPRKAGPGNRSSPFSE